LNQEENQTVLPREQLSEAVKGINIGQALQLKTNQEFKN
jgi:hypothetical protein